jgi:cellulose synthase/poly-beta-1,6-N-acetylglucosamine synthase-like glycosyltransferase
MQEVETELVVFTDANTMINPEALLLICRHYTDPQTGAVAGEKRIDITTVADATAGEGFYWRYESKLKEWESELYSVIGAAGELFSIRTSLYEPVAPDTLVDDFMLSMKISLKGYRVRYEPRAYATETASVSMGEELKRKIRIAAGGIQSLLRLKKLLLPFNHPVLAFEYISHRVLRWVVAPYLLLLVFILNIVCVFSFTAEIYYWLLAAQLAWYGVAVAGWLLGKRMMPNKIFWIPYYFCLMNYAMIAGMMRYVLGGQSVLWEKVKRK